jgi:hypothetical protein
MPHGRGGGGFVRVEVEKDIYPAEDEVGEQQLPEEGHGQQHQQGGGKNGGDFLAGHTAYYRDGGANVNWM